MTIETTLREWLINGIRDFWDPEYEFYRPMNPQEENLTDRVKDLLKGIKAEGFDYDIATEEVYAANMDIHIIAISAMDWDKDEVETIILTAKN